MNQLSPIETHLIKLGIDIYLLNKLLIELGIPNWPDRERTNFLDRLRKSDDIEKISSILAEAEVAAHFLNKLDKEKVILHSFLENIGPDLEIRLPKRPIYIEVTSVRMGKPGEHIENICKRVKQKVEQKVFSGSSMNRYIRIEIDSARLKMNSKGKIDEAASVENIMDFIEKVNLWPLLNYDICVDIFRLMGNIEASSVEHACEDIIIGPRQIDAIYKENVRAVAVPIFERMMSIKYNTIMVFSASESKNGNGGVDVCPEMSFPTEVSKLEMESFLGRLKRRLEAKVEGGQLKAGYPNIIVVRTSESIWPLFGYERDRGLLSEIQFEPIKKKITEFLAEKKYTNISYISQVMIYESNFSRSQTVPIAL